ncbi:MAG TPA: hypothetical protein VF960_08975 [Chloroflexota bacterium]
MIVVQSNYCPQNHRCPTLRVCPTGALQQEGYNAPTIDAETCIECGKCVASCRVFKEMPAGVVNSTGPQNGKSGSVAASLSRLLRRSEA